VRIVNIKLRYLSTFLLTKKKGALLLRRTRSAAHSTPSMLGLDQELLHAIPGGYLQRLSRN
jgi:hypothetical protein